MQSILQKINSKLINNKKYYTRTNKYVLFDQLRFILDIKNFPTLRDIHTCLLIK